MALIRTMAKLLKPKWALAALVVVAAWEGYLLLKSSKPPPPLDRPRRETADDACWEAVEQLPPLPQPGEVAVLRLEGDPTGYVAETLSEIIERTGTYRQPEESVRDRVMEKLKIDERPAATLTPALDVARRMDVPYAIYGKVSEFVSDRKKGQIHLDLALADVAASRRVGPVISVAVPDPEARKRWLLGLIRVGIWVVVTALLPVATLPVVRRILETESNGLILSGLMAYAAASGVLALGLQGFSMAGWAPAALVAGSVALAFLYDCLVFSAVERRLA